MSILGEYANEYEDLAFEEETNTSKIYTGLNKKDNRYCYLKIINKEQLKEDDYDMRIEQLKREEEISKLCNSENTVNLYRKLETKDNIIFELEYCTKDLKNYLDDNGELKSDYDLFKDIVISISKALRTLYNNGVMHRDIKPQNMFIIEDEENEENENKIIKLGDFGCSIFKKDNTSEPIGTILYTAPEILKNLEYDEKCDLWSLGISLYELYFGYLPYGPEPNTNTIMDIIYDEDNFRLKKSYIPTLDILFYLLLQIDPKKRMNFNDFFNFVFNEDFMKKDVVYNNYRSIHEIISQKEDINYNIGIKKEAHNEEEEEKENADKILTFVKGGHLPDIMNFPNVSVNQEQKFNNIIYYDEITNQYLDSVNQDSDYFEKKTPGAFILCTSIESLSLIRAEILKEIKKDKRYAFNLITTGRHCEKVINFLGEDEIFKNCIKNVCVYCINVKKWGLLKDKYKIIDDVCRSQKQVINFINKFASNEIKPFPLTRLITLDDYIETYKDRHYEISKFYGDLTMDTYKKNIEKMRQLVEKEGKAKELRIKNNDQNKLIEAFFTFDIKKDIETLDKLIIKEYTKNTFYGDLNKWLMNTKMNSFETVAYFTARLMYSLNNYGVSNKTYYKTDNTELKRGIRIPYSCLLPYERAKGKVILLSSFTSTSLEEKQAINFSGRKQTKEQYKTRLIFSVIYYIKNRYRKNWISNGVNIEKESVFKTEKEILYQPFSFYYVRDVQIDISNYSANIYLETVGKVEILEEKIKMGKSLQYDEKERLMTVL